MVKWHKFFVDNVDEEEDDFLILPQETDFKIFVFFFYTMLSHGLGIRVQLIAFMVSNVVYPLQYVFLLTPIYTFITFYIMTFVRITI